MFKKSKKTKVKYCKDCTYYDDSEMGDPVCKSPQRPKDNIFGRFFRYTCEDSRCCSLLCGHNHKWFKTYTITYTGGGVTLSDYITNYGSKPKE